jgi:hypothetical protein
MLKILPSVSALDRFGDSGLQISLIFACSLEVPGTRGVTDSVDVHWLAFQRV